jgi:hypothetical protein
MLDDKIPKEAANYYLPIDVKEWLERQGRRENRTPSNLLTTLIRRIRDGGDHAE